MLSSRASSCPDSFEITEVMQTWAQQNCPLVNVSLETEQFLDHHRAKGSLFKDWTAAWRTWMRNDQKWAAGRPTSPSRGHFPRTDNEWMRYGAQVNKPPKVGESMAHYVVRLKAEMERGAN